MQVPCIAFDGMEHKNFQQNKPNTINSSKTTTWDHPIEPGGTLLYLSCEVCVRVLRTSLVSSASKHSSKVIEHLRPWNNILVHV